MQIVTPTVTDERRKLDREAAAIAAKNAIHAANFCCVSIWPDLADQLSLIQVEAVRRLQDIEIAA